MPRRTQLSHRIFPLAVGVLVLSLLAGCADQPAVAAPPRPTVVSHGPSAGAQAAQPAMRELATRHYRVLYAASDEKWVKATAGLAESMRDEFYRSFQQAGFDLTLPDKPLTWLCFEHHKDFEAYSLRADNTDSSKIHGYYSLGTNAVAVAQVDSLAAAPASQPERADAGTSSDKPRSFVIPDDFRGSIETSRTLHEAAHQLAFNSGIQKRGVPYPLWLSEGLAMQFEPDAAGTVALGRDNPDRRVGLLMMRMRGRLIPLADLVARPEYSPALGRSEREVYAQSWGLFQFLFRTRPGQLKAYLQAMARLPAGRASTQTLHTIFVNSFGPLPALEADWAKFLASLPTDTTGCTRPGKPRN